MNCNYIWYGDQNRKTITFAVRPFVFKSGQNELFEKPLNLSESGHNAVLTVFIRLIFNIVTCFFLQLIMHCGVIAQLY